MSIPLQIQQVLLRQNECTTMLNEMGGDKVRSVILAARNSEFYTVLKSVLKQIRSDAIDILTTEDPRNTEVIASNQMLAAMPEVFEFVVNLLSDKKSYGQPVSECPGLKAKDMI